MFMRKIHYTLTLDIYREVRDTKKNISVFPTRM